MYSQVPLKIAMKKRLEPRKCPQEKKIPTKNQREKILDPQNTHEKTFWNQEIPTRKTFGPMRPTRPMKSL